MKKAADHRDKEWGMTTSHKNTYESHIDVSDSLKTLHLPASVV